MEGIGGGTYLFEELHVLAAEAGGGEEGELVGGGGVVEDDLEDLAAEEICQTAGRAADGCVGRGERVCHGGCVCALLFNGAEEARGGVPCIGRAYVGDARILVAFWGADV